ncbi:hypothetical protein R6V09_30255 [Streptomyces sp. W16]|uniref:hypothetical protein n=1 Tax=Streptomyces sp. W16 TaxID=3076631 RepID=UPI00295A597A|nr:hypothetical protein [Streptomyces sp. W16]MDV9174377.1 hypothetical protein [Streptomyces sp. W16]
MKSALKLPLVVPLSAVLVAGCGGSGGSGDSGAASRTPTTTASAGIPGCAPECLSGLSDPGSLPAGPHRTSHFFNGQLTVTFAGRWESHEDQPVEFSVAPEGSWDLHRVLFWSDLIPVGKDQKRAAGVPSTAPKLVAWLSSRPNLTVSKPRSGTIGTDALPAQVVDIAISGKAVNEASDCPARACADFLTWPNAGDNIYGIAEPAVLRLYLSDVEYGGKSHLFAIGIEGRDQADLKVFLPDAEKLIAGADAPVGPAPS